MQVLSVNNTTTNNSFKGLWKEGTERFAGSDILGVRIEQDYSYYPFSNESKLIIESEIKEMRKEISTPGAADYSVNTLKLIPRLEKTLSFTESEYKAYKKFYGKVLPESMKKIEHELKSFGLNQYINKGLWYKVKQFLHCYK